MTGRKENKDLAYYLTLFKLEGHETWRSHTGENTASFTKNINCNGVKRAPKVTAKKIYRIDRLTGTLEEI